MTLLDHRGLTQSGVQLAADDRWENAIVPEKMSPDSLRDWLSAAGADVAMECLYCDRAGAIRGFIGFRRCLAAVEDRCRFWRDAVAASPPGTGRGPSAQLRLWLKMPGCPSAIDTEPSGTALGVFNQWLSAVPVQLRADRLADSDLRDGPGWLRTGASAPICRERYWKVPDLVWVAEVVSHFENGVHLLDPSLLPP
jgi:hypothetical protein